VIAAVAEGRNLKVLVSLQSDRADNHVVSRPDVKTPADLRGKRFGVTRIVTGFWIYAILALEHFRLDPKRDQISIVEVGGDLPRLVQALEAGEIDAAVLDPAQSAQLIAKGFSLLLDMYPANISAVQNALVVDGAS
jgi:ABC-type nitrate/sulfonate/bicarbonate transport system substrate-binding protein